MTAAAVTQWETGRITPRRSTAALLDEALDAEGQVLAAFGYAAPAGPTYAELAQLPDRVVELERRVAQLEARWLSDQATATESLQVVREAAPVVPLRSAADGGGARPSKSSGRRVSRPTGVPADDGPAVED
jgi:hypothetical protein